MRLTVGEDGSGLAMADGWGETNGREVGTGDRGEQEDKWMVANERGKRRRENQSEED